jgi:hypothetical protein
MGPPARHDLAGDVPILLRGINRSGLEYSRAPVEDLAEIRSWGANLVRIPFNQQWLLEDDSYLDQLAAAAHRAKTLGMYVLFDLQWLAYGQNRGKNPDGSNIATPPLPDEDSPRAWRKLALRFRDDPAVMFDLLNEPHDRLPDDPFPLYAADGSLLHSPRVTARQWHPWAKRIADDIRNFAPETLLFISGTDWGFQLHEIDLENIVHGWHVYPHPGRDFRRAQLPLPTVVTEFGPVGDLAVIEDLLNFLDERQLGWCAWSWRDWPALIDERGPTAFGRLVQERLKHHQEMGTGLSVV